MTISENQNSTRSTIPHIAVIGCGAAAREFCLPVLAKYPEFRQSIALVDKSASQAELVAKEFGIQHHCTDYRRLPLEVDAAIVTTPHHLHAEQSIHFLRQGKPVFTEKPLGMSTEEVAQMLNAASAGDTTLMVNNCRRLFPAYQRVAELLHSGELGTIENIRISDGGPFEWNSVSDFYLRNPPQGKGVFLDRGAHTVDLVCWWLAGRPQLIKAWSDAMGGAEALLTANLTHGKTEIELAFSRFYKLENCYAVKCERATISGRLFNTTKFEIHRKGSTESIQAGKPAQYHEYAWQLLDNFINVVQGNAAPLFIADDVAPSMELIDETYQRATTFEMPWYEHDPNLELLRSQTISRSPGS